MNRPHIGPKSSIVAADGRRPATDDAAGSGRARIAARAPVARGRAGALLADGDAALAAGEFRDAAMRYGRVVGFDDPDVTGGGPARPRRGALPTRRRRRGARSRGRRRRSSPRRRRPTWPGATSPPAASAAATWTGPSTAYREADRRAPAEDKAEIATRLGWLTKETGDQRAAGRYFAKGRGDGPLMSVTMILIAATVIVSLSALLSDEGQALVDDLPARQGGRRRRASTGGCGR